MVKSAAAASVPPPSPLRTFRRSSGLSASAFARACGVDVGTLYAFEIGARPPSRRLREALRAAGADVEELLREHKAWRDSQSRTLLKQLQVNLEGTRAEASPELPQGVRQDRARARQREEEAPRG